MTWVVTRFALYAPTRPSLVLFAIFPTGGAGARYDLFKNEVGCNAAFTQIASGSATSFVDSAVANGTTYYYQVTAYPGSNAACSSLLLACLAVIPPLNPPTGLTATAASTSLVNVNWTAPAGALSYELQRSSDGGAFQPIATRPASPIPTLAE